MRKALLSVLFVSALAFAGASPTPAPVAAPTATPPRADLLDLLGVGDASSAQLQDVKTLLLQKRQLVIVALAGKKSRLQSLQQNTAALRNEVEKAIQNDEMIAAITKPLAALREQLAFVEKNSPSPMDIIARQIEIARHVTLIADRREQIRSRLSDGRLPELSRSTVDAEADVRDLEAQLVSIDAQLARLNKTQLAAQ
jgi:hypothetical protein